MACERLRMCGLGSSGDPVCAKATTAMAVAAETKPKQIAIRINLLGAVGMTQTGALHQLREYIAIEIAGQFQKRRILILWDSMRFLLVLFAMVTACAQDGATRADWPHYGGTQFSWRYSALD